VPGSDSVDGGADGGSGVLRDKDAAEHEVRPAVGLVDVEVGLSVLVDEGERRPATRAHLWGARERARSRVVVSAAFVRYFIRRHGDMNLSLEEFGKAVRSQRVLQAEAAHCL
jgi:hypothetical protein